MKQVKSAKSSKNDASLASAKIPISESSSLASGLGISQVGAPVTPKVVEVRSPASKSAESSGRDKKKHKKKQKIEAGLHLFEDDLASHVTMAQYLRGFVVPGPKEKEDADKVSV